jgi:6-phosphogluconate dehydrogenase
MGGNLALQAIEKGYSVTGFSRSYKPHLQREHFIQVNNLEDLINQLPEPRIVLISVPAGRLVDHLLIKSLPCYQKVTWSQIVVTATGVTLSDVPKDWRIQVYILLIAVQAVDGKGPGMVPAL